MKKFVSVMASALVIAGILAGCGSASTGSGSGAPSASTSGTSEDVYRIAIVQPMSHTSLDQIRDTTAPTFVELPAPDDKTAAPVHVPVPDMPVDITPVIRIKNIRGLSAEVFSTASPEMLHHLIEAFSHVE